MKIGVIDSSGNFLEPYFRNVKSLSDNKIHHFISNQQNKIRYTHSELVCASILKQDPGAQIYFMELKQEKGSYNAQNLVDDLKVLIDYDVDIINLSLGIEENDIFEMRSIVQYAKERNIPIVASLSNNGKLAYPATYQSVIGVGSDSRIVKRGYFTYVSETNSIYFKHDYTSYCQLNSPYMIKGNSFLSATFTGILSRFLKNFLEKTEIKMSIEKISSLLCNTSFPENWANDTLIFLYGTMDYEEINQYEKTVKISSSYSIYTPEDVLSRQFELLNELHKNAVLIKLSLCDFNKKQDIFQFICKYGEKFKYIILKDPLFSFYELYEFNLIYHIRIYQGGW